MSTRSPRGRLALSSRQEVSGCVANHPTRGERCALGMGHLGDHCTSQSNYGGLTWDNKPPGAELTEFQRGYLAAEGVVLPGGQMDPAELRRLIREGVRREMLRRDARTDNSEEPDDEVESEVVDEVEPEAADVPLPYGRRVIR